MKNIIILFILVILSANAQECPRGLVNDPYPGVCGLYTDADVDSICDLSQEDIALVNMNQSSENENVQPINSSVIKTTTEYHFTAILIITLAVYSVTYFLSNRKKISVLVHKKIWNAVLLLSFLGTGISGIVLVIRLNYGINIPFPSALFLHVETGIVMAIVSVFHIAWHLKYFKSVFNVNKE